MNVFTIPVIICSTIAGAAVNAEVQRRLLEKGGRWLPITIKSGMSGFAVMIGIIAAYLPFGSLVLKAEV